MTNTSISPHFLCHKNIYFCPIDDRHLTFQTFHVLHSTFSPRIFPVLFGGDLRGERNRLTDENWTFYRLGTRECAMERLFLLFYCKGGLRGFGKSCCKIENISFKKLKFSIDLQFFGEREDLDCLNPNQCFSKAFKKDISQNLDAFFVLSNSEEGSGPFKTW